MCLFNQEKERVYKYGILDVLSAQTPPTTIFKEAFPDLICLHCVLG